MKNFLDSQQLSLIRLKHFENQGASLLKSLVPELQQIWANAHDVVDERLMLARPDGLKLARLLATQMDDIISTLLDAITLHVHRNPNPSKAEAFALVATGGYGRHAMAPFSDVDVLFLTPYKQTPWGEQVVESMLYALWDMKLKVGHAVRSADETIVMARSDMTIRTALLESRLVYGDKNLFEQCKKRLEREVFATTAMEFVSAKLQERDQRHKRHGGSRYLVEPNVKDGKGGLRDLHTLFWLAKYSLGTREPEDLIKKSVLSRDAYRRFDRARRFLWTVRLHLHLCRGRAEERLSFDIQPEIAQRMGFAQRGTMRGVERFMKRYFLAAKDVGDMTRIICAALEEEQKKKAPGLVRLLPSFLTMQTKPAEGFRFVNGRIDFDKPSIIETNPTTIIEIFRLSQVHQADIHPKALELLAERLKLINSQLRQDKRANQLFLKILTDADHCENTLRRMNEAGVLGKFLPDFGKIVAMMQFNMYHHYTADEHLIQAVGMLAQIERGLHKEQHPLASELVGRLGSRDVIYLAMFLHDMAKGRDEDHSIAGARIAQKLAPRLGLSAADTETVAWLVRHHLLMSDVAQRRDLSDPKTIADFVSIVHTPARLRYLLVLTVADIRAVGPGVWNGWKGELLRQLYQSAHDAMAGVNPARRQSHAAHRSREQFTQQYPSVQERFLNMHYDSYWTTMDQATIAAHAELVNQRDSKGSSIAFSSTDDQFRGITRFCILTDDHPGLFSRLTGAVALSGLSVVDAKIFTTTDGLALDTLWIQDERGQAINDASRIKRLEQAVLDSLHGAVILPDELAHRRKKRTKADAFSVASDVSLDNEASQTHTLIEVSARDRLGLLYDISRVLVAQNLRISSAQIATFGEKAVDVLYVRDAFGLKVTNETKMVRIREALLDILEKNAMGMVA